MSSTRLSGTPSKKDRKSERDSKRKGKKELEIDATSADDNNKQQQLPPLPTKPTRQLCFEGVPPESLSSGDDIDVARGSGTSEPFNPFMSIPSSNFFAQLSAGVPDMMDDAELSPSTLQTTPTKTSNEESDNSQTINNPVIAQTKATATRVSSPSPSSRVNKSRRSNRAMSETPALAKQPESPSSSDETSSTDDGTTDEERKGLSGSSSQDDLGTKKKRRMSLRLEMSGKLKKSWFGDRFSMDYSRSPMSSPHSSAADDSSGQEEELPVGSMADSNNSLRIKRQTWDTAQFPQTSAATRRITSTPTLSVAASGGSEILGVSSPRKSVDLDDLQHQKKDKNPRKRGGSMRGGMVHRGEGSALLNTPPLSGRHSSSVDQDLIATDRPRLSREQKKEEKRKEKDREKQIRKLKGSFKGGQVSRGSTVVRPVEEETLLKACLIKDAITIRSILDEAAKKKKFKILLHTDRRGKSALHISAEQPNNVGLLSLLLNYASENLKKKQFMDLIDGVDIFGWTALHCATAAGQLACAQLLLKFGADALIPTKSDQATCLHHLCGYRTYTDNSENEDRLRQIINSFIQRGLNIDGQTIKNGETALHASALSGNRVVVKVLLDLRANVNIKQNNGETPLHYAARGSFPKIVKLLLSRGADAHISGDNGTAEDLAQSEKVKAILNRATEECYQQDNPSISRRMSNSHQLPTLVLPQKGSHIKPIPPRLSRDSQGSNEEMSVSFLNLLSRPLPPTPPSSGERANRLAITQQVE